MFEEYLQDSHAFLLLANEAAKAPDNVKARRFYRASIFCALAGIEAFVNHIAASFAEADSLDPLETCFLNDQTLAFSKKKGVIRRTEYHRLDDKLRLLLRRFIMEFDFQSRTWVKFKELKSLRDSLVHSRRLEDEISIDDYQRRVSDCLREVINLMDTITKGIFKQPLRKQLLDLVPE